MRGITSAASGLMWARQHLSWPTHEGMRCTVPQWLKLTTKMYHAPFDHRSTHHMRRPAVLAVYAPQLLLQN